MFGGILGAGSGVVAASYTLTWARIEVFAGDEPEIMRDALLARFLDGDAGLVLLVVSGLLIAASLFGSFVRERVDPALEAAPGSPAPSGHGRTEAMPDKLEPPHERTHPSTPVQVRPSRQWEDRAGSLPPAADRQWSNTWPSDAPGVPREENPARPGQVQQARERRRSQTRPGGPNESGSG